MSYQGENPSSLPCFKMCPCCFRCSAKGTYVKCNSCSGHHDPRLRWDPYDIDDKCRCTEGILNYKTQQGQRIIRKYPGNPFQGSVRHETETQDERDYNAHMESMREQLSDETWDPVRFTGTNESTYSWTKAHKDDQP